MLKTALPMVLSCEASLTTKSALTAGFFIIEFFSYFINITGL